MTIFSYTPAFRQQLCELLTEYFPQVGAEIPREIIQGKLLELIDRQFSEGIISIALLSVEGPPVGFSIFQLDRPESDWCKRPGWGFIREFYISPAHRRRGFGSALAAYTENQLFAQGAKNLYLTSEEAISFWQSRGWKLTREICSNGLPILEKALVSRLFSTLHLG